MIVRRDPAPAALRVGDPMPFCLRWDPASRVLVLTHSPVDARAKGLRIRELAQRAEVPVRYEGRPK
jgi:hypothetical protein